MSIPVITQYVTSSLYKNAVGTALLLFKGKVHSQMAPQYVGPYRLVKPLHKKTALVTFGIGIYEYDKEKVFIKTWTGNTRDRNYYNLINEYSVADTLQHALSRTTHVQTIRVPRVKDFIESQNSVSVVFEYVEGKRLSECSSQEQADVCNNVLDALDEMSETLTEQEQRMFTRRTALFHFISVTAASMLIGLWYPRTMYTLLQNFFNSFVSMIRLSRNRLVLAHGDLKLDNIIVSNGVAYITDCGSAAYNLPSYDRMCFSINQYAQRNGKEFFGPSGEPLLRNYIALHSAISYRHDEELRNRYLSLLSNPVEHGNIEFEVKSYTAIDIVLRNEWKKLWNESPTAQMENSPEWFEAAYEAFKYTDTCIIAAYHKRTQKLVAVMPFVRVHMYGCSVYTLPALTFATHHNILGDIRNASLRHALIHEMKRLGTVHLSGLAPHEIKMLSVERNVSAFESACESFVDFTEGPFGNYEEKKARKIFTKATQSPTPLRVVTNMDDPVAALQMCIAVDQASVKHEKGKGVFWRKEAKDFYIALAQKNPQSLSVAILFFGDTPVAYRIQFHYKNVYLGSQKAYLAEYATYKPGFLVLLNCLKDVPRDGSVVCNLGKGRDQFKSEMTKKMQALFSVIVSRHAYVRLFLLNLLRLRELVYEKIVLHPKIYTIYKNLKFALLPENKFLL